MKYRTENELAHFNFQDAHISELIAMNGYFHAILDDVTILPENSCNRDIREMRANELSLKIPDGAITSFIKEGYKVFDADGNLKTLYEDEVVSATDYYDLLKSMTDCYLYAIEKKENSYFFSIDAEESTYLLQVDGTTDIEEWERFLNK